MFRILFVSVFALATASAVAPHYFIAGFRHILSEGSDHILFILGLFLFNRNLPVLLIEMTLFTLAHSLALGLSIFGVVTVPPVFVEVAIALSISLIAIENLILNQKPHQWRPVIIFLFGGIHGLGFGHSFAEHSVPQGDLLTALFSFNVGIEVGQIVVLMLAFATTACLRNRAWYGTMMVRPACFILAAIGFCLAIQRGHQLS